jgi:hypothetical protein
MTINLKATATVWVSKVEDKGTYGVLTASTSKKDKAKEGWIYSNWYIRVVGKSYERINELLMMYNNGEKNSKDFLKKKFPITISSFTFSNEPYEKDGEKIYKNLQIVAWDWDFKDEGSETKKSPSPFDEEE